MCKKKCKCLKYKFSKGTYPKKYKVIIYRGDKKIKTTQSTRDFARTPAPSCHCHCHCNISVAVMSVPCNQQLFIKMNITCSDRSVKPEVRTGAH